MRVENTERVCRRCGFVGFGVCKATLQFGNDGIDCLAAANLCDSCKDDAVVNFKRFCGSGVLGAIATLSVTGSPGK